jgi:hypothetical protein
LAFNTETVRNSAQQNEETQQAFRGLYFTKWLQKGRLFGVKVVMIKSFERFLIDLIIILIKGKMTF